MLATSLPTIGIVAAGAMGSAVASNLTKAGCTVLTNLDGRSEATHKRAHDAGMKDVSLADMARRADWVLSILPPSDAFSFAEKFIAEARDLSAATVAQKSLVFVDCNAVNPETAKRVAWLFGGSPVKFIDAGIIGVPPSPGYDPTFYASVDEKDAGILDEFAKLSQYGLKILPLKGEGAGVGDASALKMSYAGITKGTTGILTTMILAAHASSPATARALLHELHSSQPVFLNRITKVILPMMPKAYRWVGEMEEIAGFVGGGEGDVYNGLARLYERIERSVEEGGGDVDVLKKFVEDAKKL